MLAEESANANDLQGGHPHQRKDVSIEEMLKYVDKVSEDQFISEANNMVFRVSDDTRYCGIFF